MGDEDDADAHDSSSISSSFLWCLFAIPCVLPPVQPTACCALEVWQGVVFVAVWHGMLIYIIST